MGLRPERARVPERRTGDGGGRGGGTGVGLHTTRFRHEIYSRAYGTELENLIGQPYTEALKQSEAQRYVREALEINPYISAVEDVGVDFDDGRLSISCTVRTIYGEVRL